MNTVISIENVSKYYRLGLIGRRTLSEDLTRWWAGLLGRPDPLPNLRQVAHKDRPGDFIWALREVSLQVQQGEVLGIIGRNGAGKSTLLKILSRVTAPTSGEVRIKGRLASLLEVGTGFHPELTGRQNIYLNGAILGMSRAEIDRKLDEIIDFSGVENYIDTPVKRYSSGMYVRLAFAVAAHLEPEILLVDEVLAVGDADFQKKCLGKMDSVAKEGRTVLFVSHNMGAVQRLVEKCIWFDEGQIAESGEPRQVIEAYLSSGTAQTGLLTFAENPNLIAQILRVALVNDQGQIVPVVEQSDNIRLDIEFIVNDPLVSNLDVAGIISLVEGTGVYCFGLADLMSSKNKLSAGRYRLQVAYPTEMLNPGKYIVRVATNLAGKAYHNHPNTGEGVVFEIIDRHGFESIGRDTAETSILSTRPTYQLEKCP